MEKDALRRGLIDLLEGELATLGYELLDVRLFAGGGRLNVRVFLDREGGINLKGCIVASRTISMLLEESSLLGEAYVIEASSPGVRRPLRTAAHFAAVIGQRVEVRFGRPKPATRRGLLLAAGPEGLRLRSVTEAAPAPEIDVEADPDGDEVVAAPAAAAQTQGEEFAVAWDDLVHANLDPDFDIHALINAQRRVRRDAQREERRQARESREARMARRRKSRTDEGGAGV